MHKKVSLVGIIALVCSACGTEVVVHNLGEREANKVVEILAETDIVAQKTMLDTGRTVTFSISVPAKNRLDAIKLLNRYEMPRRADTGYTEVFKEGGLIPTAAEERAKHLSALEGEVEKQLKLVEGVLDVQVQLVQPEETALRTAQDVRSPVTASVTVKYLPGPGSQKPLSEPQVQAVVAAGVERLTPDNVVVVMTPAGPAVPRDNSRSVATTGQGGGSSSGEAVGLRGMGDKNMRLGAIGAVGLVVLLGLGLLTAQIRLRTVRGRLMRLQNEIAKARRKVNGDGPPPPP